MAYDIFHSFDAEHLWERTEASVAEANRLVVLDLQKKFQRIAGCGASFTDSAASLIYSLTMDNTKEVMDKLFDRHSGIGLSLLRNPMEASDFSRTIYSYDDIPEGQTDEKLEHFTIDHDKTAILPLTKAARQRNPNLKIIASPWSPPAWMKDSGSMLGGSLMERYFPVYANYFVKFIKAYENEGLPIFAVTPQNEPLFQSPRYPTAIFPARSEAQFIKGFLKPAFQREGIHTQIWGFDHNWSDWSYPMNLLKEAENGVDGIAWHWYDGTAQAQEKVRKEYPDKGIYFTEGSGGEWIPEFEPAFRNVLRRGIEIFRNGSSSFILWNIALDQNNGPVVPGFGKSICRGLLRISNKDFSIEYTTDYYALSHFSKFLQSDAVRISSEAGSPLRSVCFENSDRSLVLVLYNDSSEAYNVGIRGVQEEVKVHCCLVLLLPSFSSLMIGRRGFDAPFLFDRWQALCFLDSDD